ncbi:universal stress protein [Halorientalis brevis]|uniref:Universal stress protein n=1 Tax=Halorientalis brevis TaxID=1126241 RepID=A0ABD6CI03_9EURY|nr:universal stress protein [Halorientalis brevis]
MYERILIPTDGSTGTAHVAMQAIDLAEQYGSTLHVLNVVDTDVGSMLSDIQETAEELEQQGQRAVERVETMAEIHGVDAETDVVQGDPADQILEYADEIDADAIVAGTHGRSGVKRQLIGSVAERLVRHANCPVMTIRLPEDDVTVEDDEHARKLAQEAIEGENYDATITGVDHQVSVWVIDADTEDGSLVVYLDPVTQRTSIVERN